MSAGIQTFRKGPRRRCAQGKDHEGKEILVIGLTQPKKPNTDAHGFPRMHTDAPRPIRPAEPGSRGRREDALESVLGRPRDPRGGRVRRPVAAETWPDTSSVCIRVYPWNIFRTPWLQPLNERLSLDLKASWSGRRCGMSTEQERSATLPKATIPPPRSAGGIGPNRRSRLRGQRPEGEARVRPEGFRAGRLRLRERSEWEHGPVDRAIGRGTA